KPKPGQQIDARKSAKSRHCSNRPIGADSPNRCKTESESETLTSQSGTETESVDSEKENQKPARGKAPFRAGNGNSHRQHGREVFLRLPEFNGDTSFNAFSAQLRDCIDKYGWTDAEVAKYVRNMLRGKAANILDCYSSKRWKLSKLLAALAERFSTSSKERLYIDELRVRRRKKGESLTELFEDVNRKGDLAYPGKPSAMKDQVMVDQFCLALGDPALEKLVRRDGPDNLSEAYKAALRHEIIDKTVDVREANKPIRAAQDRFACATSGNAGKSDSETESAEAE